MPVQFRRTYELKTAAWIQDKDNDLGAGIKGIGPITKELVDVSVTGYVDDNK